MTDSPRKFQGVWIPAERWLDRSLSPNEKVMLGEISSLDTGPRGCYATNAHFAEFFNLSISRVSEIISGLADRGLIRVELIREGKRIVERRIRLATPFEFPNTPSGNAANPFGKDGEPPSENTQGSNTPINNTLSIQNPVASGANENGMPDGFAVFWSTYPNGKGKQEALTAWKKLGPDQAMREMLMTKLAQHSVSRDWLKDDGQYVPMASTWLNKKRYLDDLKPVRAGAGGSRHTNLDQIDHTAGLELDENGNYRIAGNAQ